MATVIEFSIPQTREPAPPLPEGHSADVLPIRFDHGGGPATGPKKAQPKKR